MKKLMAVCIASFVLSLAFSLSAGASENPSGRIEGEGFATPDEAILAFADALREGDLDRMISTFAVESYCERYDMVKNIQRMQSIQPMFFFSNSYPVSGTANDSLDQYNIEGRRANIIEQIKKPLIMIALDRIEKDYPEYREITARIKDLEMVGKDVLENMSYDDLADLVSKIQTLPDFSGMTSSEPISPITFGSYDDNYLSEINLKNIMRVALIAGADGVTERGLILGDWNETYLLCMNIVRYGDRWYNCSMGGIFMTLIGVQNLRQGLIGGENGSLWINGIDVSEIVDAARMPESERAKQLVPELQAVKEDFDARHEELSEKILAKAGSKLDPGKPLIGQVYDLIDIIESEGEDYYRSDLIDLPIMSFDEVLEYFALDDLAEAMS